MTLHTNDARALFFTGRLYFHPLEIVKDPHISRKRKRALLADWASDRNAVDSKPALRRNPVTGVQCALAEIVAALRILDDDGTRPLHSKRAVRNAPGSRLIPVLLLKSTPFSEPRSAPAVMDAKNL